MAKMKLAENKGYQMIPEGETTFKIMSVDDSKYEDFGRITVRMQTAKGEVHFENFSLMRADGTWNDAALRAWSYLFRTAIGNYQADEIDTQDIVGHYITATVEHVTYTKTRGEHAGEQGTSERLKDLKPASGFAPSQTMPQQPTPVKVPNVQGYGPADIDSKGFTFDAIDNFLNE